MDSRLNVSVSTCESECIVTIVIDERLKQLCFVYVTSCSFVFSADVDCVFMLHVNIVYVCCYRETCLREPPVGQS